MANFYAVYPGSSAAVTVSGTVTADQGNPPWTVTGTGTAGTAATGVVTVQGIGGGTPVPVSGSLTATNPSVAATGAAVPADATYIGMLVAGNLTGVPGTANGLKVDGSAVTQPVSGTVSVSNFPATQPVSGTVAVSNFPATQTVTQSTTTAVFQAEGAAAFGAITNSYVTIFTPGAALKILQMRNNTDASISVSLDAGTTTNYVLDAGDQVSIDFFANALLSATSAIQIKYTTGAPTMGSFRINGAH